VTCRAVVRHQVKMLPFHGLSFGFGGTGKTKEVSLIYRRTDSPFAEMDVPTNVVQCRRDSNPGNTRRAEELEITSLLPPQRNQKQHGWRLAPRISPWQRRKGNNRRSVDVSDDRGSQQLHLSERSTVD
jgi:hypothetical protein